MPDRSGRARFAYPSEMFPDKPAEWTLLHALGVRLRHSPDAVFLFERSGASLTFRRVCALSNTCARTLGAGRDLSGCRVLVASNDSLATVVAWFAIAMNGAVEVPVNPALLGATLLHVLRQVDPEIVMIDRDLVDTYEAAISAAGLSCRVVPLSDPRESEDVASLDQFSLRAHGGGVASLLFTSGTSGPPKAAIVTEAQALLTGRLMVEKLGLDASDVFYCAHPMYHMAAKHCVILAAVICGAAVCLDRRFEAASWLDRIREAGATVTISHGPMLEMIFAQPERPDDGDNPLQAFITSPFPKRIARAFEQRFRVRGVEVWGMTELGIPCWSDRQEPLVPGTCGAAAAPWFEIGLLDADGRPVPDGDLGELAVRPSSPELISPGYWGRSQEDRPDGWARSGDLGRKVDGRFAFVDRLSHRIRRRAENVSASQVEDAALLHSDLVECAAIGVPSEYEGDHDIKLFFVVRPGSELSHAELLRHMARSLPHFMVPRYLARLDRLPRTATQKIQRDALLAVSHQTWDRSIEGVRLRDLLAPDT